MLCLSGEHVISEDIAEATSTFMFLNLLEHLQLLIQLYLSLSLLFDHFMSLVVNLKVAKRNALELDKLLSLIHCFVQTFILFSDTEEE